MRLEGKTALVTGGASGIGAATVRRFVAEGARVTIADRDQERGAAVAAEIGDAVQFVATDVTVETDVAEAIAHTIDEWGRLDTLVLNAGFLRDRMLAGMSEDDTMATISTFVFPTVEEQLSAKWLGGGAQNFMGGVAGVFVDAGSIPSALDSYAGAVNTGPLEAASGMYDPPTW